MRSKRHPKRDSEQEHGTPDNNNTMSGTERKVATTAILWSSSAKGSPDDRNPPVRQPMRLIGIARPYEADHLFYREDYKDRLPYRTPVGGDAHSAHSLLRNKKQKRRVSCI